MWHKITPVNQIFVNMETFHSRSYIFGSAFSLAASNDQHLAARASSVLAGRRSGLNCCMPLERASLMGLLESQSVSALCFSLISRLQQAGQPWWCNKRLRFVDATQEAVAWRSEISFMPLSGLLMSNWNPAEMTLYVNICWVWFLSFVARLVLWNNTCDEIWQACTQTVTGTNFSHCDTLIQAEYAGNLFGCLFSETSMIGGACVGDIVSMEHTVLLYSCEVAQ